MLAKLVGVATTPAPPSTQSLPATRVAIEPPAAASSAPARPKDPAPPLASAVEAEPPHDFEDQFDYGSADGPIDAGIFDPAALTLSRGFEPYSNERFVFTLEVPKGLVAMPPPENGDGMQWRLGDWVAMTASGMNTPTDMRIREYCATSSNVTAHKETEHSCWATGARSGFIFWERTVVSGGTAYSLRFQYAEALKLAMDPIVARVNRSWRY